MNWPGNIVHYQWWKDLENRDSFALVGDCGTGWLKVS